MTLYTMIEKSTKNASLNLDGKRNPRRTPDLQRPQRNPTRHKRAVPSHQDVLNRQRSCWIDQSQPCAQDKRAVLHLYAWWCDPRSRQWQDEGKSSPQLP